MSRPQHKRSVSRDIFPCRWHQNQCYKYSRCQAAEVNSFTNVCGLSLCLDKCAVLSSSHTPISQDCITIGDTQLPIETAVKCLGVWWDFSPARSLLMKEYTQGSSSSSFLLAWRTGGLSRAAQSTLLKESC